MIHVDNNDYRDKLIYKLVGSRELDEDQKATLKAELGKDEYKALGPKQIQEKLNRRVPLPNPEPPKKIEREYWEPDVLKNVLLQTLDANGVPLWIKIKGLAKSDNPQLQILGETILELFTLKAINMRNPQVQAGLNTLVSIGLLSRDQLDQLLYTDDPGYQEYVYTSPAEQMFGYGAFLESNDLLDASGD